MNSYNPVRILHIFGQMERGGAEMRTLDLMRSINRETYSFEFCVLSGIEGELDSEIRQLGGDIHYIPLNVAFPIRFSRLMRTRKFNVVQSHVHYMSGPLLGLAAASQVDNRICHFRVSSDMRTPSRRRELRDFAFRRMIDRFATNIIAVSEGTMVAAWKPSWKLDPRCEVVYNGLPSDFVVNPQLTSLTRELLGLRPTSNMYLHVGRMDAQKNHLKLISIFDEILKIDSDAYLILVGRGGNEMESRIRAEIERRGISDRVKLLGVRKDVKHLMFLSDLMVFPSIAEGLPGVILEACQVGLPVVASDISGVREISSVFPSVKPYSISESDASWARKCVSTLEQQRAAQPCVHRTQLEFGSSPFTVERCVESMYRIWTRTCR